MEAFWFPHIAQCHMKNNLANHLQRKVRIQFLNFYKQYTTYHVFDCISLPWTHLVFDQMYRKVKPANKMNNQWSKIKFSYHLKEAICSASTHGCRFATMIDTCSKHACRIMRQTHTCLPILLTLQITELEIS